MVQKNRKRSFLSILWNWLKRSVVRDHDSTTSDISTACPATYQVKHQVKYLERCWVEDCLVEKVRKQLEEQWSQLSQQD